MFILVAKVKFKSIRKNITGKRAAVSMNIK